MLTRPSSGSSARPSRRAPDRGLVEVSGAPARAGTRRSMNPRVGVANLKIDSPDGTFQIGRESFPQFASLERLGVHIQSDLVRVADPASAYVEAALTALADACLE